MEDADLLEEKWKSVAYHVTNVHSWDTGEQFHRCEHDDLPPEEARLKKWIKPDSPAHGALLEVILHKNLVRDIRMTNRFIHTGQAEVYHSLINKYAPKRQEFDLPCMVGRMQLATLDHNMNTNRKQATVKEPHTNTQEKGALRFACGWRKATQQWVARPIYEPKDSKYTKEMMTEVLSRRATGFVQPLSRKHSAQNIAKTPCPPKAKLIAKHVSRFSK